MILTGGTVVTPDGARPGDVVVDGERIVSVTQPGAAGIGASAAGAGGDRHERIDVSGCLVLPGGVDPHAHALSGTAPAAVSAACGGTTTVLSFTLPLPTESPAEGLVRARDHEVALGPVDMGLHASYLRPGQVTRDDLVQLRALGVSGVKAFLAYPELGIMFTDGPLYELLRDAAGLGLTVQVHCELGEVIEALVAEYLAAGRREATCFAETRPVVTEDEAVRRTLALAGLVGATVYLVHMTTTDGLEQVRRARARGQRVWAEACTHHLLLDADHYRRDDAERFLIAPPLRAAEHVEALWEAVADGTLDAIGSDHSQVTYHSLSGSPEDFTGLPYGFPGAELRVPLVLSEGSRRGVPIERLVELLCTGPARAFGHHPRKGVIAPGSDADLVVWDPEPVWQVDPDGLHDGWPDTPYRGLEVRGRVRTVFRRGVAIVEGGEPTGAGEGRFLAAQRPPSP